MAPPELLISVVIPTFNYAAVLPRAVESVVPQLAKDCELLIIDDGSTDGTTQVLATLQNRYPGAFRSIRKSNGGASSARNLAIRETSGQFLIFLDADDEMAPGAINAIKDHIAQHPGTRMVIGGHCSIFDDGSRREHLPTELPASPSKKLRDYLLGKRLALSNGACAMHRDVFSRGGYPEQFRSAEDIPIFAQVLANYPCTVLARQLALIHKHDDSLRHHFSHAKNGGLALIDEVFAPRRLGSEFQALKEPFYVQRCLSLFRSAWLAGDVDAATGYFRAALRKDWRVLTKGSYVRKALRLWLGFRP